MLLDVYNNHQCSYLLVSLLCVLWPRCQHFQSSLILSSNIQFYSLYPKVLYHRFTGICPFRNNNYSPDHHMHSISFDLLYPLFLSETSFIDLQRRTLSHSEPRHFLSSFPSNHSCLPPQQLLSSLSCCFLHP